MRAGALTASENHRSHSDLVTRTRTCRDQDVNRARHRSPAPGAIGQPAAGRPGISSSLIARLPVTALPGERLVIDSRIAVVDTEAKLSVDGWSEACASV